MNKINDGGPAFPTDAQSALEHDHYEGMTLRDYFAAKAMGAICSVLCEGLRQTDAAHMAKDAYFIADAMIAARNSGSKA